MGLVGHWTLDDSAIHTTVVDSSASSNNGVSTRNTVDLTTPGPVGTAFTFNGTGDRVTIPDSAALSPSVEVSVSGWFWFDAPGENVGLIWTAYNYILFARDGYVRFYVFESSGSSSQAIFAISELTAGWNFIVGTFDGTQARIYLRGEQIGNTGFNRSGIRDLAGDLYIGYRDGGVENYFDGKIDDVRIYNSVLSSGEMETLYLLGATQNTKDFSIGAVLQKQGLTKDFSIGSQIVERLTKDFLIGSQIVEQLTKDFLIGSQIVERLTKEFSIDAQIVERLPKEGSIDAQVVDRLTKEFSIGAVLQKQGLTKDFLIGSQVIERLTKTFTIGAHLAYIKTFTLDAVATGRLTKEFTIAAALQYVDMYPIWPLPRPVAYDADKVWDEETELWYSPTSATGAAILRADTGRYQHYFIAIGEDGDVYYGVL